MRSRAVTTVLLAAALLLTGCANIPTHGAIETSSATATTQVDQFIRTIARPPRDGDTPKEIVAGFLSASASLENDHAVARTFLTEQADAKWRPDAGVTVYETDPGYRLADFGPGQVRMLALEQAGSLTARGQFEQPTGENYRADFTVRKVDGQWRIAGLPNGLILDTAAVNRAYRAVDLFFLDSSDTVLVPDPLFLPAQQPGISTALARELLAGPTAWLAPAVHTAFPKGTHLAVESVPVEGGIARVDLDSSAVAATGDLRRGLAAQLTYTLSQLPNVTGVRITLNGVPYAVPGIGPISRITDWESFDPDAAPLDPSTYAVVDGHLASVTTAAAPVAGYFGRTKNLQSAAVALDGQLVVGAVPTGSAVQVRIGSQRSNKSELALSGRLVTSLSYDRTNLAWATDRRNGITRVYGLRVGMPRIDIKVEGLGTRSIESLRVSRDGARVALVVADQTGASGTLLLGRVQRANGVPVVAGLRRIESTLEAVEDVGWADDTTLLTVARRGPEASQAYTVGVDGDSVVSAGAVPTMLTVAACPERPNLAGTAGDLLWSDRGNGWRTLVPGTLPVYPG